MSSLPTLSICVPSRNRQPYFQETIRSLMSSLRTDVEFVFVDNSDDPSIMDAFIAPYLADPRVRYVRSGETVRSMMDNWELALATTTGRWISVIGDDDYIDPDAALIIGKIEAAIPDIEAIDWTKLYFTWPYEGKTSLSNAIYLNAEIHEVPRDLLMDRAFRWVDSRDVLGCGFGIYHGAVSRVLMERMRSLSKTNRYFEHPVVDYENIFKVIMHGRRFVHCRRPLSVMGVCPLSNSAAIGNSKKEVRTAEIFDKELGHPMESMDCYRNFPFGSRLGVSSTIAMTHHWFVTEYGYRIKDYGENFARACTIQCEKYSDREQFDRVVAAYRTAFAKWEHGRYLKYFKPSYKTPVEGDAFSGLIDDNLFVSDAEIPCRTPDEYYRFSSAIIEKVADIKVEPQKYNIKLSA